MYILNNPMKYDAITVCIKSKLDKESFIRLYGNNLYFNTDRLKIFEKDKNTSINYIIMEDYIDICDNPININSQETEDPKPLVEDYKLDFLKILNKNHKNLVFYKTDINFKIKLNEQLENLYIIKSNIKGISTSFKKLDNLKVYESNIGEINTNSVINSFVLNQTEYNIDNLPNNLEELNLYYDDYYQSKDLNNLPLRLKKLMLYGPKNNHYIKDSFSLENINTNIKELILYNFTKKIINIPDNIRTISINETCYDDVLNVLDFENLPINIRKIVLEINNNLFANELVNHPKIYYLIHNNYKVKNIKKDFSNILNKNKIVEIEAPGCDENPNFEPKNTVMGNYALNRSWHNVIRSVK